MILRPGSVFPRFHGRPVNNWPVVPLQPLVLRRLKSGVTPGGVRRKRGSSADSYAGAHTAARDQLDQKYNMAQECSVRPEAPLQKTQVNRADGARRPGGRLERTTTEILPPGARTIKRRRFVSYLPSFKKAQPPVIC